VRERERIFNIRCRRRTLRRGKKETPGAPSKRKGGGDLDVNVQGVWKRGTEKTGRGLLKKFFRFFLLQVRIKKRRGGDKTGGRI